MAIDGTLLTQRLHFAPMTHPYRHVLGWYRIIKELQEEDIAAICIFDGVQRSAAKKLELERRRQMRKILASRSNLELHRFRRLLRLKAILTSPLAVDSSTRHRIAAAIRELEPHRRPPSNTLAYAGYEDASLGVYDLNSNLGDFDEDDITEVLLKRASLPVSSSQDDTLVADHDWSSVSEADTQSPRSDTFSLVDSQICDSTDNFISSLKYLFGEFQNSAPQLTSLDRAPVPTGEDSLPIDSQDVYAMSKTQQQLTYEEGRLWSQLSQPQAEQHVAAEITTLTEKSHLMLKSYDRRNNPPTGETYEESREILRSMGVPCIVTDGPLEAEALASSLVANDHADFVVSEDTDVLIYEAPMIRNLTRRDVPLVVVSGSDVRRSLSLDRFGFVDFALLLGTDFSQRIKNVGPARALKFIREHGSIEEVLKHEKKYSPPSVHEYLRQVDLARQVFASLPALPPYTSYSAGIANADEVHAILKRRGLLWAALDDSASENTLSGNFYSDNPSAR